MARSKRRMPKRSTGTRRRPKADWVYRPNLRDEAGALVDDLGSYSSNLFNQGTGIANASAMVLYDSHNRMANLLQIPGVINAPLFLPRAARAEGRRAKILRVQGVISLRPTVWALGSILRTGWRFGVFEQNPTTGNILVQGAYTMWVEINPQMESTATWANSGRWQHERRLDVAFNDNSQIRQVHFNFPVNRSLAPSECYAIYQESPAASVNFDYYVFFRTLVVDEG